MTETVLIFVKNILDKLKIYELKIEIYTAKNQLDIAIKTGIKILESLQIPLSQSVPENLNTDALYHQPEMRDPIKKAALKLLMSLCAPTIIAQPKLLPQLVFTMVQLCVQYGNSPLASYAYVVYGSILSSDPEKIEYSYQLGQLALKLLEKFNSLEIKCKVEHYFNVFLRYWKENAHQSIQAFWENVKVGLETGDTIHAGYSTTDFCSYTSLLGKNLDTIHEQQLKLINFNEKSKQDFQIYFTKIWGQFVENLINSKCSRGELNGSLFKESEFISILRENQNFLSLFSVYFSKLILSYLFKDYPTAIADLNEAQKYHKFSESGLAFIGCKYHFYQSLVLLAVSSTLEDNQLNESLEKVAANQEKLKIWANHAPINFQHNYQLVEAEKARVLGQNWQAAELYDCAIAGAQKNQYILEQALANELAAEFYLKFNKDKIAQTYMIEAYYCYSHWGSKAKVLDLEKRYPQLLAPILEQQKISLNPLKTIASLGKTSSHTQATISNNTTEISDALDFTSVIKASQALSSEIELNQLISRLMEVMMENAGATKGVLILSQAEQLTVQAISTHNSNDDETIDCTQQLIPVEESLAVPLSVINLVKRRLEPLNLDQVSSQTQWASDHYFIQHQPQSLLCLPLCNRGEFFGILYLENNLTAGAFTEERVEVLKLLCSQAAISLENAHLYQKSQEYAQQLEKYLKDLQEAQVQLVQSEKMSALGQMISGIAHEINNPVGFIGGNLSPAEDYIQDLIEHLNLYQEKFPEPGEEIVENAEEIDLDYVLEDLPQLISSMKTGVNRIKEISTSMRIFARSDKDKKVSFDVHEGIDSTLLILKHRLKANEKRPDIQIIKDYGNFSQVLGFPGQLNQVFMNIIANGIDVFDEMSQKSQDLKANPPQIWITTAKNISNQAIEIRIKDNGAGIPEAVKYKIFDHLFTTKEVGKGTGLGLAISRQIVEDKHSGKLSCYSEIGQGTEFIIEILDRTY